MRAFSIGLLTDSNKENRGLRDNGIAPERFELSTKQNARKTLLVLRFFEADFGRFLA